MSTIVHVLPSSLGDQQADYSPFHELVPMLQLLVAESERGARQFLKHYWKDKLRLLPIRLLNEHTSSSQVESIWAEITALHAPIGLISDGGTPGVADPGQALVWLAHQAAVSVVVWPGPSSITMALSASGLNGQQWVFHGYLPREERAWQGVVRELSKATLDTGYTQMWIETPYRSKKAWEALAEIVKKTPRLAVSLSAALMLPSQYSGSWRATDLTPAVLATVAQLVENHPTVFIVGAI